MRPSPASHALTSQPQAVKRTRLSRAPLPTFLAALRRPARGYVASRGAWHVEGSHDRISLQRGKQHLLDRPSMFPGYSVPLVPEFSKSSKSKHDLASTSDSSTISSTNPGCTHKNGQQLVLDGLVECSWFARPTDKIDNSSKHGEVLSGKGGDINRLPSLLLTICN